MKTWDVMRGRGNTAALRDPALIDALFAADDFEIIEDEGTINLTNNHWIEAELGVICSQLDSWFLSGNCAALALALSDKHKFPLVLLFSGHDEEDSNYDWFHTLVKVGEDAYLDANGVSTKEQVLNSWAKNSRPKDSISMREMSREDCTEWTGDLDDMSDFEHAMVLHFAQVYFDTYMS